VPFPFERASRPASSRHDLYGHLHPDIIGSVTQALDELIAIGSARAESGQGEEERKNRRAL
jgi:hypothetical protein